MNKFNAAIAAGYSYHYARQVRPERIAKVSLNDSFEQAGLTDKKLVEHALEGLKAKKLQGEQLVEVDDWGTRHRYFESICKLTDRMIDKVKHSGIPSTTVNVYPQKTVVFQDITNDQTSKRSDNRLHESEGSSGTLQEIKIQSP